MVIRIDSEYKCHASPGEGLREFSVPDFDGKAPDYIEGYRYIPPGELWVDEAGNLYEGRALFPWREMAELDAAQHAYARLLADVSGSYRRGVDSI